MSLLVTKSDRAASQLRDALRIDAWKKYKSDHKDEIDSNDKKGSAEALYQKFEVEWKAETIHKMEFDELKKFILEELGYSLEELNQNRSKYYEGRKQFTGGNTNAIAIASSVNAPVSEVEEVPYY